MHTPFVPFSILFARAVQLFDVDDLARLDRFAASLKPEQTATQPVTHPYRLYELLCRAARLYIETNNPSSVTDPSLDQNFISPADAFYFARFDMEAGTAVNESLLSRDSQADRLGDWYFGNQQLMSLLDEDVMF